MNSIVNQQKEPSLPALNYGYVSQGETTKWIFWEDDPIMGSKKICLEINAANSKLKLDDEFDINSTFLVNTPSFYNALGVDWITKALPHPQLYLDRTILEQVALKKVTNPVSLAGFILGEELSKKVSPKLFSKNVLANAHFDSWDRIKIAIFLLMVTENVQKTIREIALLTHRFSRNYAFYRLVNLCFKMSITLDCFLTVYKVNKQINILDGDDKYLFRDSCLIILDGEFDSCRDLTNQYPAYANSAVSIAAFQEKQKKSIYFGTLPLPKGMNLIETPEDLVKEGRRMSHCVGSYVPKLKAKKSFFLHVKLDVSATVEIVKNSKKRCFEINQVHGVNNKSVPGHIVTMVKDAISTFDAQYFFFKNSYKSRKRKVTSCDGPTLFD